MKRFEFSLDRLLKVKRQRERLAELEQHSARQAVDAARARVQELQGHLARVAADLTAAVGRPLAPHQWATGFEMSDRIGGLIQAAEREVGAAEQRLWEAAQERAAIATEVEALDTLRRQQWDQWRQEYQKADQERLDELGLRRWQAAQAAPTPGDHP